MKLALLTEANPRMINQSHPSFIQNGRYRVIADGVKSKLSVRCRSLSGTAESVHGISDEFDGNCVIIIDIIEAHPEDSRINVFAERLNV